VSLGELGDGEHTVYARATLDQQRSEVAASTFTVAPDARVEWQLVARNGAPASDNWRPASGVESWGFEFQTAPYGKGAFTLVTRLVEGDLETARSTVRLRTK
jgi:hypothetical protein